MKLTEAEWIIMNALWEKHPATARDIARRLPEQVKWAYTTIKTMLSRLVDKEAVSESKKGNRSLYEPIVSRQRARRSALRTLADQAFDGTFGPLVHFLVEEEKLTSRQRRELVKLLSESEKTKGERK